MMNAKVALRIANNNASKRIVKALLVKCERAVKRAISHGCAMFFVDDTALDNPVIVASLTDKLTKLGYRCMIVEANGNKKGHLAFYAID